MGELRNAPSVDLHLWLKDIDEKYCRLSEFEELKPDEQKRFNEEILDLLYDIVNTLMMFQIKLKNFENVYEIEEKTKNINELISDDSEEEEIDAKSQKTELYS
jgi:hypothetical protein